MMVMTVKNRVDVKIAGKEYTLVGTEPKDYIIKTALMVDVKMNEIMNNNDKLSMSMAAVLTAVNIADDVAKVTEREKSLLYENNMLKEQLDKIIIENKKSKEESSMLSNQNSNLQFELAKREAELSELRKSLEKISNRRF